MTLLDAILRETYDRRDARFGTQSQPMYATTLEEMEAERRRFFLLASRIGPKGALAGHLEELLRHG